MEQAFNPIGQITNAEDVAYSQLQVQKAIRRAEDQIFNVNNAVKHTNPSIPDTGKILKNLATPPNPRPGSVSNVTNINLVKHSNPSIPDAGAVVRSNSGGRSKVGSRMDIPA